jgi:hypothetical protein
MIYVANVNTKMFEGLNISERNNETTINIAGRGTTTILLVIYKAQRLED